MEDTVSGRNEDGISDNMNGGYNKLLMDTVEYYQFVKDKGKKRKWITIGVIIIQIILALTEIILACIYRYWFGVVLSLFFIGLSLVILYVSLTSAFYSHKTSRLRVVCSLFDIILTVYVIMLIVIHLAAMSTPDIKSLPTECSEKHEDNCFRITMDQSSNNLTAPVQTLTFTQTKNNINRWLSTQKFHTIVYYNEYNQTIKSKPDNQLQYGFWHVMLLSFGLAFPDDMYIQITTDKDTTVTETQSQARLGKYDFNVNYKHVKSLILFIDPKQRLNKHP